MLAFVRAAFAAALVLLLSVPTNAADKLFKRDDLADAAIKLEAQIKAEAGQVTKPAAALRREADAAFQRNDFRSGMQILGQIVAVAADDSANWLRLAKTVLQIRPSNDRERTTLLERAATAAYIAYQRSGSAGEEAESLVVVARTYADRSVWRPALDALRVSLDLREVAEVRQQYERIRADHGFRLLDYSVDADAASPRVCFQFSEDLPGKRTDFSPFVSVAGQDKPAISVQDRQLCVEGLKHGERYAVTLRAGIPSTVKETLSKSSDFNIYVRDRKPLVRFTGKSYVLPRAGQRGIPVVSVNTAAVALEIYRIGDRNLLGTVVGHNFRSNLHRYDLDRLTEERGFQVWKGEMTVEQTLNTDVTTAFPVDQAIGTLAPGVYFMVAEVPGAIKDEFDELATQWFIVSDLGLTALSGNDGIHAFVHSLDTTQPKGTVEIRLLSRANEILARKRTSDTGHVHFEANLTRGEGSLAPAMLIASDSKGDYAFLNLKAPAFDLSDRGVSGRVVPAGLDAFVFTERGVYRSGETVQVTALLRDSKGMAALNTPVTLVVERPDGVEYRRSIAAGSGRGRAGVAGAAGVVRSDRYLARARIHRSEASAGWRGDLHGRGLRARPARIRARLQRQGHLQDEPRGGHRRRPLSLRCAGGQARARRRGDREAGQRAAGLCPLSVRAHRRGRRDRPGAVGEPAGNRCQRQSPFPRDAREAAGHDPSAGGSNHRPHGRAGRARGRAQAHPAGRSRRADDRRQAAVLRALAGRGRECGLRRDPRRPRRHADGAQRPALRAAQGRDQVSMVPPRRQLELRAGEVDEARRRRPDRRRRRRAGTHLGSGPVGPLPPRSVDQRPQWAGNVDRIRRRLVCGGKRRYAGPLGNRARQAGICAGRKHDGRSDRPYRRQGHAQRDQRPAHHHRHPGRDAGPGADACRGRQRLGQRRLCGRNAAPAARPPGRAHARPCHRRAVVLGQPQGTHACARPEPADGHPPEHRAAHPGQGRGARPGRGGAHRRGRRRCRHPQPDRLQAAGTRRLLPRPTPAHRRHSRPLRPTHRRHAGRAWPDQDRR